MQIHLGTAQDLRKNGEWDYDYDYEKDYGFGQGSSDTNSCAERFRAKVPRMKPQISQISQMRRRSRGRGASEGAEARGLDGDSGLRT
ncbi:MAG: hypothetical protein EA425_10250 [Puniceicoccaceae bacterium]|nr:MAG: hypothetical protein EA425_10250 [Puniceicoccaceae bacterium]